jgi:predicted house-cleaning noncanonical NTP pyrophosphatase (MazG superfamily)
MDKQSYSKLVRDKIPEIIKANGSRPITRILDDKEYLKELIEKVREETAEFEAEPSLEELADIQEVLMALLKTLGSNRKDLEKVRAAKAAERGGFAKKIFLEGVE